MNKTSNQKKTKLNTLSTTFLAGSVSFVENYDMQEADTQKGKLSFIYSK